MIYVLEGNEFLRTEFLNDFLDTKFKGATEGVRKASIFRNPPNLGFLTSVSVFSAMAKFGRVIVWDFSELKKLEKFNPYVIPKDIDIFVIADKIDQRLTVFKTLKAFRAELKQFKDLYPNQVENWISQRKKSLKLQINPDAIKQLAILYGTNLSELDGCLRELVKLGKIVDKLDVFKFGTAVNQFSIFELQDEMLYRRPMKSLYILKQLLRFGEQPIGIIRYFVNLFDRLHTIKMGTPKQVEDLKQHPFILKKLKDMPATANECLEATEVLKSAELSILKGVPPEFAVQKAILTICRIKEKPHVV